MWLHLLALPYAVPYALLVLAYALALAPDLPTLAESGVAGFDIATQRTSIKSAIGYMSQLFSLYGDLTVDENIRFFAGLYGVAGSRLAARREWVIEMAGQVGQGLDQIRTWIRDTLHISDSQFATYLEEAKQALSSSEGLRGSLTKAGLGATHVLAGTFISLFALFFFLYEGDRIWSWVVRLFPTAARERVASSGEVAWGQLTAFTRATLLVALVDAAGITLVALILRVPFALAIGALVFLGAFIPIVGALMSGLVAVLIALVAHGPIVALLMLAGVIAEQQLESHVLQPFLLGRAVSVHPLAVVLAITAGVVVAGIVGALVAVPVAAVLNGVFKHLHGASVAEAAVGPSGELPPLDPAVREAAAELDAESHRAAVTERIELDGPNGSNGPNDSA